MREILFTKVTQEHDKASLLNLKNELNDYCLKLSLPKLKPIQQETFSNDPKTLGELKTTVIHHPQDQKSERIWLKYTAPQTEELLGDVYNGTKPPNQLSILTYWQILEPYLRPLTEEDHLLLQQTSNDPIPFAPPTSDHVDPLQHRLIQVILMDKSISEVLPPNDVTDLKQIDSSLKSQNEDIRDRLMTQLRYLGLVIYDKSATDELAMAIKHLQRHLKLQEMINQFRKQELANRVKFILAFHQYSQLLTEIEKEIEAFFNKKLKNRKKKKEEEESLNIEIDAEITALLQKRKALMKEPGEKYDEFTKNVIKPEVPKGTNHADYNFLVSMTLHFQKYACDFIPSCSIFDNKQEELKDKALQEMFNWCVPYDAEMDLTKAEVVSMILEFWNEPPFPEDHPGREYLINFTAENLFIQ